MQQLIPVNVETKQGFDHILKQATRYYLNLTNIVVHFKKTPMKKKKRQSFDCF